MRTVISALSVILILGGAAAATTYIVHPDGSGDFPTIRAAVNAASHGDSILLGAGTFTGIGNRNIDYLGKAIVIRSEDGDPDSCIIVPGYVYQRAFIFQSSEGPGSRLEAVTIRDATWNGSGGAILIDHNATPRILNCVFENCWAYNGHGGAIFASWEAGGAEIFDCRFTDCEAWIYGGAITCWGYKLLISGCSFFSNSADIGGAVYASGDWTTISDCLFCDCQAVLEDGGACCIEALHATIHRCIFSGNTSGRLGGGLSGCTSSQITINQSTFYRNSAEFGGGVYVCDIGLGPLVSNCTFAENVASTGSSLHWSGYAWDTLPQLENCIFAFGDSGAAVGGDSAAVLTCCDIYGNAQGDWVGPIADQLGINGNFSLDPCFCDMANDDFRLWNHSPCVQAECGLIGAWPVGCWDPQDAEGIVAGVEPVTWLQFAPNPSGGRTTLIYRVSAPGPVHMEIYDAGGRLVRRLVERSQNAGIQSLFWDGNDFAGRHVGSGAYLCRLRARADEVTKRIVVVRQ